ncbi:metal-sulfur cluster assembly factor [Aquincola sp. S2]|uniref:Metal-sulfur cluster assembly factor n=1 Tax=Pseudaquabacterium terrae TaxID=2732868 RepID=A0ABX2ER63_9BURK|nr:metal-sulfur cluster assembly factor [Aquabacterium terrae]NRF71032.1 metal-sulfur cluster assembly factor [Aquabacterium terrae]
MNDRTSASPYPYIGPALMRMPIEQALMRVVDPEVALSIVDVGLVYGVTVADGRLHAVITMTSAACPVTDLILEDVETALDRVAPEGFEIAVELVWEPAWSPDRMSPRAKAFMGW